MASLMARRMAGDSASVHRSSAASWLAHAVPCETCMQAGRVLQDGTAALTRDDALLQVGLHLVGAGIDAELGVGRCPSAAAAGCAAPSPACHWAASPPARDRGRSARARRWSDAPNCRRCRPARAPPRPVCRLGGRRAGLRLLIGHDRRRLGDMDGRRIDVAAARLTRGCGIDRRAVGADCCRAAAGSRMVSTIGRLRMSKGCTAKTKNEEEQDMQRRHQHRGGGARQRLAAAFFLALGAGRRDAGTGASGHFRWPKPVIRQKRFPAAPTI